MNERLTLAREAEIEQRAEAATPGPWEEHAQYGEHFYAYLGGSHLRGVGTLNFGEGEDAEADKALTVNAREDIRALLAELSAVRAERNAARARVAELEEERRLEWLVQGTTPHTPRLCACGHSHHAHRVPAPHSCFAHGQTCPCEAYRQLPHDEAVAQLDRNRRAATGAS